MVLIILTGNYNFFNWVSIVMCLSLVDDDFIARLFGLKSQDNQKGIIIVIIVRKIEKLSTLIFHSVICRACQVSERTEVGKGRRGPSEGCKGHQSHCSRRHSYLCGASLLFHSFQLCPIPD